MATSSAFSSRPSLRRRRPSLRRRRPSASPPLLVTDPHRSPPPLAPPSPPLRLAVPPPRRRSSSPTRTARRRHSRRRPSLRRRRHHPRPPLPSADSAESPHGGSYSEARPGPRREWARECGCRGRISPSTSAGGVRGRRAGPPVASKGHDRGQSSCPILSSWHSCRGAGILQKLITPRLDSDRFAA
jgi:hypothetical protein